MNDAGTQLFGVGAEGVIAAIRERGQRMKTGGDAQDGRRIGLVIEGGAMRGVCSGGGALALAKMGFTDLFDEVYATSSGVMNAAYFLSDQADLGITIYYEELAGRRFINPWRVWKVLDVDYVFDRVVSIEKKLDVERITQSRSRFFVVMMDAKTGELILIDTQKSKTPLLSLLKAATAIPVLYNRSVEVEGRQCIDGGLLSAFPIEQAVANGCTDVLVLLTRTANFRRGKPGWISRRMFNLLCVGGSVEVKRIFAGHHEKENRTRDLALGKHAGAEGVRIATVCAVGDEGIERTTRDAGKLKRAAELYAERVRRIFEK